MATFRLGNSGRGHRGRLKAQRTVLGIPELDKRLEGLQLAVANRVARSALAKGARVAAKTIKSEIPSRHKAMRKAIGSSVKRVKSGPNKGFTQAKAGAAVGKKAAKQKAEAEQTKAQRKAEGKPGVGISAQNIHWYILGTRERTVTKTGQRVGKMPANPIIQQAMARGKGRVFLAVRTGFEDAFERERAKLVRKHLLKHGS